ncbi:thiamine phosphate synthase [Crateriforma spongiae]|uniref:thiamine phosphate synthase n=1 Tax=Crateriforma spongiae TaxID=2724528 RepID=UPI001448800E|nr:thiamine phosphate synthase [Crateriforma spongiae]
MSESVYRILDASLNRVGEGLRTLEEYARFVLDHPAHSATGKQLRHDLATAAGRLSKVRLLSARDTAGDVGTTIGLDSEASRESITVVVHAATQRTGQSLRCLEEYGKCIDVDFAADIERLRYVFYDWSARLGVIAESGQADRGASRRKCIRDARLYFLIDAMSSDEALASHVVALADAGVDVFQLRDRSASDRTLYRRSLAGAKAAGEAGALWVVNDRADIAAASNADGVHVGQDELPIGAVRGVVGPDVLIGVSTHDVDQATEAVRGGADYIGCGPVFAGRTKSFDAYVGPAFLSDIVALDLDIPAFAIGGIDAGNVRSVIDTGCARVAVTGALRDADEPTAAARALKAMLSGK